ncbi:ABC transporter permease [bacterium]|nr:ABC transporter permease [bacterium]
MRSIVFLFREFIHSLSQNKFLHFSYGAQVTISLLVLGIFFLLLIGAAVFWGKLGENMVIHAFLEDKLSALQVNQLEEELSAIQNVASVEYRSKEQALEEFAKRSTTIPLEDLLEDNPLPASFIIRASKPANIEGVVGEMRELGGILTIRYGKAVLANYMNVFAILVAICVVTIGLLVIFTYSSINNIIGLSIFARRSEIRIMQLVGATSWFIRWPFLFEGVFLGITGALFAYLIILGLLMAMGEAFRLSDLELALPAFGIARGQIVLGLVVLLAGLGAAVGFFGSLKTVNGFLQREANVQHDALRVRRLRG